MVSDEEKRRRFSALCSDGQSVDELCDGVLGCRCEEPVDTSYRQDSRIPHQCIEMAEDSGFTLDGCVGRDVGVDLSEEDFSALMGSGRRVELVRDFIDEAPTRMCYTCAVDFAEGYLQLQGVPKGRQKVVIEALKLQLESKGARPSRRKDEQGTEPLYLFKEELVNLIDYLRN